MLKIRALNRESSSDEDAPTVRREAQEEQVLDLYTQALKLQRDEKYNEAEQILLDLIEDKIPALENDGGLPKTMSTIKYSCQMNLGNISLKLNEFEKALNHYTTASSLDKNDVTLWYKIGKLALKLDKFRQAAYAFSNGLECNESHWPCLDELISILYSIHDRIACLEYITKALLLDSNYTKGLVLRKKIYAENPATRDYYKLYNPDYILEPSLDVEINEEDEEYFLNQVQALSDRITEVEKKLESQPLKTIPLPEPLEDFTWVSVGKTVISLHKYLTNNEMSHFTFVDLKKCMSVNGNNNKETGDEDEEVFMETEEVVETTIAAATVKEVDEANNKESEENVVENVNENPSKEDPSDGGKGEEESDKENDKQEEAMETEDIEQTSSNANVNNENSDDVTMQRRTSQYSENNSNNEQQSESGINSNNNNQAASEDNEEMEMEGDDIVDAQTSEAVSGGGGGGPSSAISGDNKPKLKSLRGGGNKRKRDLLSDLQIWGWHSKRKYSKKGRNERDHTIEDALIRIIPNYLLPDGISLLKEDKYNPFEDSMSTMEIYKLHIEENSEITPLLSPLNTHSNDGLAANNGNSNGPNEGGFSNNSKYFGTEEEKNDVIAMWTQEWKCCDSVNLIEAFVLALATKWNLKWPKELIPLYLEAYNMFREHIGHPHLYGRDWVTFEHLRIDALATLLYGELTTLNSTSNNKTKNKSGDSKSKEKEAKNDKDKGLFEKIHGSSIVQLQTLSAWDGKWTEKEYPEFFIRVHWLRAHLFKQEGNNSLAIVAFQLVKEEILEQNNKLLESNKKQHYRVSLPNCDKYGIISRTAVNTLLENLELIDSLSRLEELFNAQKYVEVSKVLRMMYNSSRNVKCGRIGRPAQLGLLLHSLWYTDFAECFVWTEECLFESVEHYIHPKTDQYKWEMLVDKCLRIFYEIIKSETICIVDKLSEEKRIRMVGSLCRICCKQINTDSNNLPLDNILPWILLHYVLLREEQRRQAKKNTIKKIKNQLSEASNKQEDGGEEKGEEEIPSSTAILFSAHEFLGSKGWCLNSQGQLLHFIIDTILDKLDTPIFENLRDKLDIHLEQAFFCLYQHPSKKNKISRHLADHNVNPLPLNWDRAQQIYEFFSPCALPEFDSYKSISISSDLEQLLQRILNLVPQEIDPTPLLPKILDYINGVNEELPEKIIEFAPKTRSMYYLLGDYYFKQSEVKKSTKYFQMDLCINPWRLDSWACMALGSASQLEQKLTHCEKIKNEFDFLDRAKSAKICFQKALSIANDHVTLWIEYGSFEYMVHSFCSRLLKYESETYSMEKFEILEEKKESYLLSSQKSFERALELHSPESQLQGEADERWLYHYMLAKISEKRQKEPSEYLQYYLSAVQFLRENNATYPEKINYNNPPHLSVESLEVHYRIYASILKYLELHEGKDIPSAVGKIFRKALDTAVFPKYGETATTLIKKVEALIEDKERDKPVLPVIMEEEEPITPKDKEDLNTATNFNLPDKEEAKKDSDKGVATVEVNKEDKDKEEKSEELTSESKKSKEENDVIILLDSDEEVNNTTKKVDDEEPEAATIGETMAVTNEESNYQKKDDKQLPETSSAMDLKEGTLNDDEEGKNRMKDVQEIMDAMMRETMDKQAILSDEMMDVSGDNNIEVIEINCNNQQNANIKEAEAENEERIAKERKSSTDTTTTTTTSSSTSGSSSSSSSSDSDSDDSSSSSTSSSSDENSNPPTSVKTNTNNNLTESEILYLVDRCIAGLEQCIRRLPQNYKAIYRLSHLYYNYNKKKDLVKSKQLFLSEYKCKNNVLITGLFSDRKPNNFFNGVWRIPNSEIDRPGSLAAHMGRCVTLLLQVLRATSDHKTLFDLCLQLKRQPDPDKVYIRHSEREQLSEQAISLCIQSFREQIKNVSGSVASSKLLTDLFKSYQRCQKSLANKESVFEAMLCEVYKKFSGDENSGTSILDNAVKFCQQLKVTEKLKRQQMQQQQAAVAAAAAASASPLSSIPRNPLTPMTPPVLPAPLTTTPVRRPGVGRPRGRPPGPKSVHTPGKRGRPPLSASSQWNSLSASNTASFDYLRQYQEMMLRQYSQTLTMAQMAQLLQQQTSSSTNTSAANTAAATANLIQNNMLLQSLQQQLSAATTSTNQLNQAMSSMMNMNPAMLKQIMDQFGSNNTNAFNAAVAAAMMMNTTQQSQQSQVAGSTQLKNSTKSNKIPSSTSTSGAYNTQANSSLSITSTSSSPLSMQNKPNVADKKDNSVKSYNPGKDLQIIPTSSPSAVKSDLDMAKTAKLMKERPSISITPVQQTTTTTTSISSITHASSGTVKQQLQQQQLNRNSSAKFSSTKHSSTASNVNVHVQQQQHRSSPTTKVHNKAAMGSAGVGVGVGSGASYNIPSSMSITNVSVTGSGGGGSNVNRSSTITITPKSASNPTVKSLINARNQKNASTASSTSTVGVAKMSPTKTLQEKLADKQKQAMGKLTTKETASTEFMKTLKSHGLSSSISVLPSFAASTSSSSSSPAVISTTPLDINKSSSPRTSIVASSLGLGPGVDLIKTRIPGSSSSVQIHHQSHKKSSEKQSTTTLAQKEMKSSSSNNSNKNINIDDDDDVIIIE